jgi:hypothetical protein
MANTSINDEIALRLWRRLSFQKVRELTFYKFKQKIGTSIQWTYILYPQLALSLFPWPFHDFFERDTEGIDKRSFLLSIIPVCDLPWFDTGYSST